MNDQQLRELFRKLDVDGNGYIEASDYRRSLRGYASHSEIRAKIHSMDENFVIKTNGDYMWIKADRKY